MEGVSLECLDPRNARQLGLVQRSARHDHEARLEHVAAISGDSPASGLIVPAGLFDSRLEAGLLVEMELLTDALSVGEDFRREGVPFLRDIVGLFEQWQIKIAFNVALGAGITIPVPGAAKIPGFLDDAKVA